MTFIPQTHQFFRKNPSNVGTIFLMQKAGQFSNIFIGTQFLRTLNLDSIFEIFSFFLLIGLSSGYGVEDEKHRLATVLDL